MLTDYLNQVDKLIEMSPKFKAEAGKWREVYKSDPRTANMSEAELRNEIAFKITKQLIDNPSEFNSIVTQNMTVAQKIRLWLRNFLNRLMKTNFTEEQATVRTALRALETAIKESKKTTNTVANDTQKTAFSIKALSDGKQYVQADRKVLNGSDSSKWAAQITYFINEKIRKGNDLRIRTVEGDILTLTVDTGNEAGKRNIIRLKGEAPRLMNDAEYATKLNAVAHIDQLAAISKAQKNPDGSKAILPDYEGKHDNKGIAQDGWSYRNVYFKDFDGQYYLVKFSVAIDGGTEGVYNVGILTKKAFPIGIDAVMRSKAPENASTTIISENSEKSTQNLKNSSLSENIVSESSDNIKYSLRSKPAPKETTTAYKVFNQREDGNLYPLYINPDNDSAYVEVGKWYDADAGEYVVDPKNGRKYVKAQGGLSKLAYRPGWHSSSVPYLDHIGIKGEDGKLYLPKNFVWAEVEIPADVDYQPIADKAGKQAREKQLDYIPTDGYYLYKTNSNAAPDQQWPISGALKVNRILSDNEAYKLSGKRTLRNNGITKDIKVSDRNGTVRKVAEAEQKKFSLPETDSQVRKLTTNLNPTTNEDIRYSLPISKQEYGILRKEVVRKNALNRGEVAPIGTAYTANNFYVYENYGDDSFRAIIKLEIEGNESLITHLERRYNNASYETTRDVRRYIMGYEADKRYRDGHSSNASTRGADGHNGGLYKGKPQGNGVGASAESGGVERGTAGVRDRGLDGKQFSLPETDRQGRKLTEAQREFFNDSKVVDGKVRLLAVYRGTN